MPRRPLVVFVLVLLAVLTGGCGSASSSSSPGPGPVPSPAGAPLFRDRFDRPDGLVTNEYAYWNPGHPDAVRSPDWEMTSGSLFTRGHVAWSGVPDARSPDARSRRATNSAVFRLTTRRSDFGDVSVSLRLRNQGLHTTKATPREDWDGVHVFLRYQDQRELYYASINRRDGKVSIKKKLPGGPHPANGGTYYELAAATHPVPYGRWEQVRAVVRDNADGSVSIWLLADGVTVASATDRGRGGPPIRHAGKVGVRGDNAEFELADFEVDRV